MGEYELVIFLTGNRIYVMEVDLNSKSKIVGFHGEDYYQYDKIDDIDDFYKNITDTYNVDDLSELSTNVFLIDCGMEQETKWHLIEKLKSCECLNINNLSCLLPILLSKKGLLQVGKQIVVEFLAEKYAYICDDEYHVEELVTRGKKAQQVLEMEDFSFIAVWEGNLANGSNSETDEKFTKAQSEWEIEKNNYEEKLKEFNNICKEWEDKYKGLQKELNEKNRETLNNVSKEMINRRRVVVADVNNYQRCISETVPSGETVKANQQIGKMQYSRGNQQHGVSTVSLLATFSGRGQYISDTIYAPRAGKLIWVPLDGDDLFDGDDDDFEVERQVVGVVGDETDNDEDMIQWARSRTKKYFVE